MELFANYPFQKALLSFASMVQNVEQINAKVLEGEGVSRYDNKVEYRVGKTLEIKDFDLMYNIECSTGIHFFWSREEAEHYLRREMTMITFKELLERAKKEQIAIHTSY